MLTKEKLRMIQEYLMSYQTTGKYKDKELENLICLLQGEIHDLSEAPINLKPCKDGEMFDIDCGYSQDLDMTFTIRRKLKNGRTIGEEVCGFYYGKPDLKLVHDYINQTYWEDERWAED